MREWGAAMEGIEGLKKTTEALKTSVDRLNDNLSQLPCESHGNKIDFVLKMTWGQWVFIGLLTLAIIGFLASRWKQ